MTSTTSTTSPAANATSEPAARPSRARQTLGLFAAVGVLVTANVAFAAPAATSGRELVSPAPTNTPAHTHTPTQGDLLRTTNTPTVVVTHREPLD